jgi:multiple sugar transport system substrate-binding protein
MVCSLREQILSGKLGVNKFLPSESELAKRYQLSNLSVRKGLDILVQEQLIEKIPSVGNRVASPSPVRSTVVKFGYHSTIAGEAEMARLLGEFHRLNPHIRVDAMEIPTNNYYSFVKQYMDSQMLDIITINNSNFQDVIERGGAELFEETTAKPGTYPFLLKAFTDGGKLLALPLIFSPLILCYNREHFREKRLPEPNSGWTWSELFDTARKLAVENERFGFYFHLLARNRWPVFLLQSGMAFEPDERGQYNLCETTLIQSLNICRELIAMPDVFPVMLSASDADAEELFLEQKVSVIMTTYFALNDLRKAQFAYDLAPLPSFGEYRTLLIEIGLAVNRKSMVKEAAQQLADYLTSFEAQTIIRRQSLSIPADQRAAEWQGKESVQRPSRFHMYREIIPTYRLISDLKLSTAGLNAVQRQIKLYWSGLQDEDGLCRSIEKIVEATE